MGFVKDLKEQLNGTGLFSKNNMSDIIDILACPVCGNPITKTNNKLSCSNNDCKKSYSLLFDNIFSFLDNDQSDDTELSIEKWNEFYSDKTKFDDYEKRYQLYLSDNYDNVYRQISENKKFDEKTTILLEIGCGPMFLARALSDKCKLVVGIDFSIKALKTAKAMLEKNKIKNYILIHGDIKNMPIKDGSIDIIYGGGVIEHFTDTYTAIQELYRVLKPSGISFNTVPHLNIGSLTYRQVWGNIPNFPVLKQIAEFIHIKLLKSKHMTFGYELSFLATHLKYLHSKAGFKKVEAKKFETKLMFEFIPTKILKNSMSWLANNSPLFWPMIKVIGTK